ncbi:MAG: hypothetical protein AB7N71_03725 [Phycisphaerae bacterium]
MNRQRSAASVRCRRFRVRFALLAATGVVFQLIPFGCGGRNILNLVTPVFFDDTFGILDAIVAAVAPLVLPG